MRPLAKEIIRYISLNREAFIILTAIMILSLIAGTFTYKSFEKTAVINDNGNVVSAKTLRYTVKEVLEQKGIEIGPFDELSVAPQKDLQRIMANDIYIKRAVPIRVTADGKEQTLYTAKTTVFEALTHSPLDFSLYDRVIGAAMPDPIRKGMQFELVRVKDATITEKQEVPYSTIRRESRELAAGEEKIVRKGSEGMKEQTFRVLMENGKEIAKQLVKESLIMTPEDRVVEYGHPYSHRTSRGGIIRYKKVLDVRTTAYTASYEDTGKAPGHPAFGITYTGVRAKRGIVAVDPAVIPLGSRLYVEIAGSTPDYGHAVAGDIGGAIKGNIIDLYLDDSAQVRNWGVRNGKVYVLDN